MPVTKSNPLSLRKRKKPYDKSYERLQDEWPGSHYFGSFEDDEIKPDDSSNNYDEVDDTDHSPQGRRPQIRGARGHQAVVEGRRRLDQERS